MKLMCSLNAIFGKVGRSSSEEVEVASKCMPILLYGIEACDLIKSDIHSLEFALMRFLMKLFKTCNTALISESLAFFKITKLCKQIR